MQIHELTLKSKSQVSEGVMGDIFKAATDPLSRSAADRRLKQETQKYVQDLTAQWQQQAKSIVVPPEPVTTAPVGKSKPKSGQMSATLAKSKTGKNMRKMFGRPRGGIADMDDDLTEAGEQPLPLGSDPRTEQAYKQAFQQWAEEKLNTTESRTKRPITLSDVMDLPGMKLKLASVMDQIVVNRNNPQQLNQAVSNYLTLAINGIQGIAKQIRSTTPVAARQQKTIKSTGDRAKDELLKRDGWTVTL